MAPVEFSPSQSIEWTKSFEVGDPRIDAQHRHLFKLANRALQLKEGPDRKELQDLLFKLYAYVEYHFAEEEALMEKRKYPGLAEHRDMHQEIIRQLNAALKTSRSIQEMTDAIFKIMSVWVTRHILEVDRDLSSCVR